jgi:hypothetical protein
MLDSRVEEPEPFGAEYLYPPGTAFEGSHSCRRGFAQGATLVEPTTHHDVTEIQQSPGEADHASKSP